MNKSEIIEFMAKASGLTKTKTTEALSVMLKSISKSLKKGEPVTLVGFGTFKITKTKARKGRNPQTGKELQIKAGKRIKFVAGKGLKASVK